MHGRVHRASPRCQPTHAADESCVVASVSEDAYSKQCSITHLFCELGERLGEGPRCAPSVADTVEELKTQVIGRRQW